MSRPPPSSLTSDDLLALAQVRKDIWVNAAKGFVAGGASSYLLYRATKLAQGQEWFQKLNIMRGGPLSKNAGFAAVMVGASLGSFIFASTTGKNSVHTLHPVFARGAKRAVVPAADDDASVNYRDAKYRAQAHEDLRDIKNKSLSLARSRTQAREQLMDAEETPEELRRQELERNRIMRRESLTKSFQTGHGGLSDSHGGHWVQDQFRKE